MNNLNSKNLKVRKMRTHKTDGTRTKSAKQLSKTRRYQRRLAS